MTIQNGRRIELFLKLKVAIVFEASVKMVKILKCFNFRSSHILEKVSGEPVCLAFGRNFLFAATNDCNIEVFSKGSKVSGQTHGSWCKYCSFKTGADIGQLLYNTAGSNVFLSYFL